MSKTALVVSAHSADFVWRCGGAIALHQKQGYDVTIVCLSYGERGESAKLWKQPGMTLEGVKAPAARRPRRRRRRSTPMTSASSTSATTRSSWTATPSTGWST
jgi:LmbE family N-acetylglucosaminyl deacetylase